MAVRATIQLFQPHRSEDRRENLESVITQPCALVLAHRFHSLQAPFSQGQDNLLPMCHDTFQRTSIIHSSLKYFTVER
jgi:hypothetical protein